MSTKSQDGDSAKANKVAHERIVRVIKHQTGGPDMQLPAAASESTIHQLTVGNGMDFDVVRSCLSVAVSRGDLLKIRGREARTRYAVLDEEGIEGLAREEMERENPQTEPLKAAIEKIANNKPVDEELLGRANTLMMELRETIADQEEDNE